MAVPRQARTRRTARRWAPKPPKQPRRNWAGRKTRPSTFRTKPSRTGCRLSTRERNTSRSGTICSRIQERFSGVGCGVRAHPGRRVGQRMGEEFARIQGGCQADGHAQCRRRDHGRHRQGSAGVDRRRSRPDHLDQNDFQRQAATSTSIQPGAISFSASASSACARRSTAWPFTAD